MSYNYEQSIWGRGVASLAWSSPTSFRLRQSLEAIKDLPAGSAVLEIGCGAGQFIRAIKQLRPELVCHGSDISQEALRLARETPEEITYTLSEGCSLPYADASMDAVLIFDVLEHVDDPEKLLREIHRVLKNPSSRGVKEGVPSSYKPINTPHAPLEGGFGGILYMFVPCEGDSLSWWYWLDVFGLKKDLTKKHAGHINYFSRKSLLELVKKNKFEKKYIRYSEHVVGQAIGIISFMMMDRVARRKGNVQINNETFFTNKKPSSLVLFLKSLVNGYIYLESTLLSRIPSPNVHVVVKKQRV